MERRSYVQLIIILLLASIGLTCKNPVGVNQNEGSKNALVAIQLESDFRDDSVKVELDSRQLFAGRVETNFSIHLAWSSDVLAIPAGVHTVRVSVFVSNIVGHISTDLHDTMTVTANYDRQTQQLEFRTYNRFLPRR
jgi:hypothetical protein